MVSWWPNIAKNADLVNIYVLHALLLLLVRLQVVLISV
jgi:hypothetical protein